MGEAGAQGLPGWVTIADGGVRVAVKVRPGAKKSGVRGLETDAAGTVRLAVEVDAPPVDGKANDALMKLLAKRWKIPRSRLSIASGASARTKVIEIAGRDCNLLRRIIALEDVEKRV